MVGFIFDFFLILRFKLYKWSTKNHWLIVDDENGFWSRAMLREQQWPQFHAIRDIFIFFFFYLYRL